ncbi:hypothetical protein COCON_G00224410 [Conger conger]|uniref:Uncharacterized protein n=1 Tax=Conger conger TaxID=82655 RepID=A0A9Q1HNL3_CONCO|nr:hypothetical protein COCON_G00224410 [Conger conger]
MNENCWFSNLYPVVSPQDPFWLHHGVLIPVTLTTTPVRARGVQSADGGPGAARAPPRRGPLPCRYLSSPRPGPIGAPPLSAASRKQLSKLQQLKISQRARSPEPSAINQSSWLAS